jgi:hypothetical protein
LRIARRRRSVRVVRDGSEGFLRLPCHVRVGGAVLAAGAGLDQAVAVGIEIVFRVVAVEHERGGEGVGERAVDPG